MKKCFLVSLNHKIVIVLNYHKRQVYSRRNGSHNNDCCDVQRQPVCFLVVIKNILTHYSLVFRLYKRI